jgi:hypothetical protein
VKSARELAEIGLKAGCEFDRNSQEPVRIHTVRLRSPRLLPAQATPTALLPAPDARA